MLLYCNQDTHQPKVSIGKMDHPEYPYCAQITFIPNFNNATLDDAYDAYVSENNLERDDFTIA